MKFCSQFYDYLYVDHYEGAICLCPWIDPGVASVGNLLTDDIDEAFNSDHAFYLRSTMDDQSFRYCRPEACPHIQNNSLEEVTPEEYARRKKNHYRPTTINLAYDFVCNQFCETCRKAVFVPPEGYAERMNTIRENLAPYLDTAIRITASGHGDPFASPHMMDVLEKMRPQNTSLRIQLETNGVFLMRHIGRRSNI